MDGMEIWGGSAHAGSKRARERAGLLPPHPPPATCASIPFVGRQAGRCVVILNHRARECRPYRDMSTPPQRCIYSPRGGLACHLHHHQAAYGPTVSRPRTEKIRPVIWS